MPDTVIRGSLLGRWGGGTRLGRMLGLGGRVVDVKELSVLVLVLVVWVPVVKVWVRTPRPGRMPCKLYTCRRTFTGIGGRDRVGR